MPRNAGVRERRISAKLLTWMPGISPEMMPRMKPKKMEIRRRDMEMSMKSS